MTQADFYVLLPLIILASWAVVLLLVDLFIPKGRKWITATLAGFGLALALGFALSQLGDNGSAFNNMVVLDGFSVFVNALILSTGLLGVAFSYDYIKRMGIERGEYYTLMLFSIVGMMLLAHANDLIIVFLGIELLSLPLYVLAAFAIPKVESEEAGFKYFLLGAFSSGFVLYGIALVYGAVGSTSLNALLTAEIDGDTSMLLVIGAALILVGLGFKISVVPFHMWTPDVYQGAPTAVTAFMAAGVKTAGFAALLRIFTTAFSSLSADLTPILWALSMLTMILGNLIAISQTDIKRMLAYSSISHVGYILMAFVPYGDSQVVSVSIAAGLFYLVAYTITNFGAWGVVMMVEQKEGSGLAISDYAGLGRKYPLLAASMAVFMLSLIGFPPTLGLLGKFYLFRAVLSGGYVALAIIGVVTSLISAYYYLRVVVTMYMDDGQPKVEREFWVGLTTFGTALATVLFSLMPSSLFAWASEAVLKLF